MGDFGTETPGGDARLVRRFRDWQVLLLLAAAVWILYGLRLTALPLRGEEPRRGRIAVEMIATGDWIVPRQQGQPFLSRPPLQNWVIGLLGLALGRVDAWAIRMPSVLSVLLTVGLLYGYSRTFLSPLGAAAAALSYAGMAQVLQLGRLGETEALFTLLVAGALIGWHWGHVRGIPAVVNWGLAGVCVALGTLCKGPQAPVYFAGGVGLYLLVSGQWRTLLSWRPWFALGVCIAVWSAWQIPFGMRMGWSGLSGIYGGDVAMRFDDSSWLKIAEHLWTYPAEVFACMLPGSLLLLAYLQRGFRRQIGPAGDQVLFLACVLAVTFPTCWLVPGARGRYFMPLYPCLAPLIGLVYDRGWPWPGPNNVKRGAWLLVAAVLLGGCLWVFPALSFEIARSECGTQQAVEEARRKLPSNVRLVSFGYADWLFTYYYGDPIRYVPWPKPGAPIDPAIEYFCFGNDQPPPGPLPFRYEKLAEISCERYHLDRKRVLTIARRLRDDEPGAASGESSKRGALAP